MEFSFIYVLCYKKGVCQSWQQITYKNHYKFLKLDASLDDYTLVSTRNGLLPTLRFVIIEFNPLGD